MVRKISVTNTPNATDHGSRMAVLAPASKK